MLSNVLGGILGIVLAWFLALIHNQYFVPSILENLGYPPNFPSVAMIVSGNLGVISMVFISMYIIKEELKPHTFT